MEVRPGYKLTEVGVIPDEWEVSTVGGEFSVQLGKMLDAERNVGVAKPYLGNKAVQWNRIDITNLPTVPMSPADIAKYRLREGDLLVCEGGEVGRAAIWHAPLEECYFQKALHRLRPLRAFEGRLMGAILRRWSETGVLANYVTQTSIAHLPRDKFIQVPLPRPPRAEQHAIASALSDVDALLDGLDRLIDKKRDLKQAVMQQLLTGRTRLPGFHGEWQVQRLGDMGTFHKGKGLPKSALTPYGSEQCVHYGELFTQYGETIRETISRTNKAPVEFRSVANDVLMPTSDVTPRGLAKASCVMVDDVVLGGDILVIRTDPALISGTFLSLVIRLEDDQVLRLVIGTTVFHLYAADMKKFTFRLPQLAEQEAIVSVLSDMDAELAALEARRDKTHALKQGMMQELLTGRTRLV
jgi:type I restriction enzyme S subunit